MKISPFTPLFFDSAPYSDGVPSRYLQTWATTDQIMVQIVATASESKPAGELRDAHTGETIAQIAFQQWQMNSDKKIYFFTLQGLSVGHYKIYIYDNVGRTLQVTSDEFRVTDDVEVLRRTALFQYRFKDNKQREDVVSVIDHMEYFFDFRVPGGFKDSGWQFGVENEQFATQYADLVELYARDYLNKTFTLGGPEGVPVWYGEILNRLLTCSYVYIDGVRYARNESETPSMSTLVDGMDSFVFTQSLRKVQGIDPTIEALNQISIRRVSGMDSGTLYDTNRTTLDNDNDADNYVLIS